MNSSKMTKEFYSAIKAEGLKSRTNDDWDEKIISAIERRLSKKEKVLDLGCGYGRIAIPLAKRGYNITGIDLCPSLIDEAKKRARKDKVKIDFKVGNMCHIPFRENSFDKVLCLWSSFNELLTVKEQTNCIKSVKDVLKPHGKAIFEGGLYVKPTAKEIKEGLFFGHDNRIKKVMIADRRNDHYNHDEKSLSKIMKMAGVKNYKTYITDLAGRDRLFLEFTK